MPFSPFFRNNSRQRSRKQRDKGAGARKRRTLLTLEYLEDRTVLSTFGLLNDFSGFTNRQIDPLLPSPSVAAGPSDLVASTNDRVAIYSKGGGAPTAVAGIDNAQDISLVDFFRTTESHTANNTYSALDTRTLYDRFANRFMVLTAEVQNGSANSDGTGATVRGGYGASESHLYLAVSTSSHPLDLDTASGDNTTDWNFYRVDGTHTFNGQSAYIDNVKIAVDASYLYVTGSYRSFGNGQFAGVMVSRFDKTLGSRLDVVAPAGVSALTPVQSTDPSNPSATQLFVDAVSASGVRVWSMDSSGNLSGPTVVSGTAFTSHTGGAPQAGTSLPLDTGGDQPTNAVYSNGAIWTANTVDDGSGFATAHWYQIDGTALTVTHQGDVTDIPQGSTTRTLDTYLPAVAVDGAGNLGIAYTHSSPNDFASAMFTVLQAAQLGSPAPAGSVLQAGQDSFKPTTSGVQPWGDTAALVVDPWDGQTFWDMGEYAAANSVHAAWGTWLGSFAAIGNDRFHQNGNTNSTPATATNLGVGPGIHLTNLALSTPGQPNYYYFEVLRQSSITVNLNFYRNQGDLQLEVDSSTPTFDSAGNRTDNLTPIIISHSCDTSDNLLAQVVNNEVAELTNLAPGRYYIKVSASANHPNDTTNYSLSVDPLTPQTNRVFYVNDSSSNNDYYALAPGNDANSGLSPYSPKASVQSVLANYNLGPNDMVVIDTGAYGGSTISLDAAHEGAAYAGSPGGTVFNYTNGTQWDLSGSKQNLIYGLTFQGGGGNYAIYAHGNGTQNSTDNEFRANTFSNLYSAIRIDGGSNNLIRGNSISNIGFAGIYEPNGGSDTIGTNVPTDQNTITNVQYGIYIQAGYQQALQSTIQNNVIIGQGNTTGYGIYVANAYNAYGNASVAGNKVSQFSTGIEVQEGYSYSTPPPHISVTNGNEVFNTTTGIYSSGSDNSIYGNLIHDNTTGIAGSGILGGTTWSPDQVNLIYNNNIGIDAGYGDTIQFNRIYANATGIQVSYQGNVNINHNLIYRNTAQGILDQGSSNVDLENNTIFAPLGNAVQVEASASSTTIHNNILWAEAGYDEYVATDSQQGFASDYNNLFTDGTGQIVHWQKDFNDLFDWQVEANFDNHSIGYTTLAPTLDNPLFVDPNNANLSKQNYHLQDASVLNGPISTSIDAGDPASLFDKEPAPNGGRIDLGAYGDTNQAAVSPASYIKIDYPNFYADWEVNVGHSILWHTFNVTGNVSIDLYQDNGGGNLQWLSNIAVVPASDGFYGWSPAQSGITPSTTARYRIKLTVVNNPTETSISREGFSVPISGHTYYVNDPTSQANDYYTTALGNNRHTGKTPGDPKANILPILHSYFVGPGDTVLIDSGNYVEVRNVTLSGDPSLGRGQGATFEGPAPDAPTDPNFASFTRPAFDGVNMVATLDRQNTFAGSTDIDVNQGGFVTLRYLTAQGAQNGIVVHNGSSTFHGDHLTATGNSQTGIQLSYDAFGSHVDFLTAYKNGGDGIQIFTPIDKVSNSIAHDNGGIGFNLSNTGSAVLEDDQAYKNSVGISVYNYNGTTIVGNPDLTKNRGNLIHDNTSVGVSAGGGGVLVIGNTISNNPTGVSLDGAQVVNNLVSGGATGIIGNPCATEIITGNTVHDNTGVGIAAYSNDMVQQNVVYNNGTGIQGLSGICYYYIPFSGTIQNNLIYHNSGQGIEIHGGSGGQILGNTVYQTSGGDAVRILSGSYYSSSMATSGMGLRDNILWVDGGGYDLNVSTDSEAGFNSDYNLLNATNGGKVSLWQGVAGSTLKAWFYTAYNDRNSITGDPLFVNAAGGDFHLQSLYGSNHGGTLAPVLNVATGLPIANPGTSNNTDANQSPAIDRGASGDSFANEPLPNGNFINLGAYGNTAQASLSPTHYVLVTNPTVSDIHLLNEQITIQWRSESFTTTTNPSTVTIALMEGPNAANLVSTIASGAPNTGSYTWTIPNTLNPASDYWIKVSRADTGASGLTSGPFRIAADPANNNFSVAVSATPADTDANPANDGLTPGTAKASIRAILETYNLASLPTPNSTINVAAGTYNLTSDILVTAKSANVQIQGTGGVAVQDRGALYPVFHLVNTSGIGLTSLGMAHGSVGVLVESTPNVAISNDQIYGNQTGLSFDANSGGWSVQQSLIHDNSGIGLSAASTGSITNMNQFANNGTAVSVSGNSTIISNNTFTNNSTGIFITGNLGAVSGNTINGGSTGIVIGGFNNANPTTVTANIVSGAGTGISVGSGANAVIGGPNQTDGNSISGNSTGISLLAGAVVENNNVFANTGNGIYVYTSNANIELNYIHDNSGDGVVTNPCGGSNTIHNNTVVHNSGVGIHLFSNDTAQFNDVYSNAVGIQGDGGYCYDTYPPRWVPFSGTIQNDLVYANTVLGIALNGANGANIVNNTVYQQAGDAVRVQGLSSNPSLNVTVKNNILSTQSANSPTTAADIEVSADSEGGFVSDYNQLQWLGTAHLGTWQGVSFDKWTDWFYQVGQDHHSLTQDQTTPRGDPKFVNPAGSDGILGYSTAPAGSALFADDSGPGFSVTGTGWTTYTGAGYNNDFVDHAGSYTSDATASWTFTGLTPGTYQVAVTYIAGYQDYPTSPYYFGTVPYTVLGDNSTPLGTSNVYQGSSPSDFTDNGANWHQLTGTYTIAGTTLTVRMSDAIGYLANYGYHVNADAVRIQRIQGDRGADDNFHLQSGAPGIDAGDPASAFANEPAPNGGRVNLGYDGNTSNATTSPAKFIQVLSPAGLEKFLIGQTITVSYHASGEASGAGFVKLEFYNANTSTWVDTGLTGSLDANGNGSIQWTIPPDSSLTTAGNSVQVRVTVIADGTQGVSSNPFQIADNNHDYYLNAASGDDTQSGKDPLHPMKSLAAMLAAYQLTSLDTIHLATGTYPLLRNAVLTAANSGVHIVGSTTGQSLVDRGDNTPLVYTFNLVGAQNVTLDHLGIKGGNIGVLADRNSTGLTISNSEILNNGNGLSLAGDNTTLTNNLVHDNATKQTYYTSPGPGIVISGNHDLVQNNQVYNNSTGIQFAGVGETITGNKVHDNQGTGISGSGPSNPGGAASTISTNLVYNNTSGGINVGLYDYTPADKMQVSGNTVFGNSGSGVSAGGNVLVTSNYVHGQSGIGISVSGSEAANNVVWENGTGIIVYGGTADGNRVYHNTGAGIFVYTGNVLKNQVYSNSIGIQTNGFSYYSQSITNNLIYANQSEGVEVASSRGTQIVNNTIYNSVGNAVVVKSSTQNITLKNNILWSDAGSILNVDGTSEQGFQSDYNFFHTTGGAKIGHWQGQDFTGLADWFYGVGLDHHSQIGDPKLGDSTLTNPVAGTDQLLGFSTTPIGPALVIDDNPSSPTTTVSGFSTTGSGWTSYTGAGFDGTYQRHGQGTGQNTATWTFTGLTPGTYQVAITFPASYSNAFDAPFTVLGDNNQVMGASRINEQNAPSDFNTTDDKNNKVAWKNLPGSFTITGSTLTVQLADNFNSYNYYTEVADAVRVQRIQGDGGFDDNFHAQVGSPTIDAGDPTSSFANEPAPNGGRVNVGADGNTSAAQVSPAELVQVLSPTGFEKLTLGSTVTIAYHSQGAASGTTYTIKLSRDNGVSYPITLTTTAAAVDANGNGSFAWTIPNDSTLLTTGNTALIEVTANDASGATGVSNNPFLIANAGHDYYLSPTGNDSNSGKSADQPMFSLAAMTTAYGFQPGDTVHMATGTYNLVRDVQFTSAQSGAQGNPVTVQGPTDGTAAVIDRGNPLGTVVSINGATDLTLDYLTLQGGGTGVNASNGSHRLTISNSEIRNNQSTGLSVDASSNAPHVQSDSVHDNGSGVYVGGPDAVLTGNTLYNNNTGLTASGARGQVSGNTVYGNQTGINVGNSALAADDEITVSNNLVHDNKSTGIYAASNALVSGNTVYNQQSADGIDLAGGEARGNTVYGNSNGILAYSGLVDGNRVFNNSQYGIYIYGSAGVIGNYVYSNDTGIYAQGISYPYSPFTGLIVNNLVYANQREGVVLSYTATGTQVVNNTIYTPVGDALRFESGANNVLVRNNILAVDAGYDVFMTQYGQTGENSDYNLFSTGVAGSVGYIQAPFTNPPTADHLLATLGNWQAYWAGTTSLLDTHSVSGAPMFVNPQGDDNILGFTTEGSGHDGGKDDNFYLAYNSPGVEHGDNTYAPATDIEGFARPDTSGGAVDIGAYEFRGNVADANSTPPTVVATNPTVIDAGGSTIAHITKITVTFSEDVNPIDANAPAAYELRSTTNPNLVFPLIPEAYVPGSKQITLDISLPSSVNALPPDTYQFTIFSRFGKTIHDLEGTPLKGNDSSGSYIKVFTVLPLISVTPVTASPTTSDNGGSTQIQVVLNQQPTDTVTIPLHIVNASDGVTRGSFSSSSVVTTTQVVFTPSNWNPPQFVTVYGVEDHIDEGSTPVTYKVAVDPAQSNDTNFNNLKAADVQVTALNNDVAGVTVTAGSNLTTTESGGQATFRVMLNTIPRSPVSIDLSYVVDAMYANEPIHASISTPRLTFDATNWNVAQTVTVTGLDDNVDEGHNTPFRVHLAQPSSSDTQYAALGSNDVSVTAINDDHFGFVITPVPPAAGSPPALTVNADGGTATYTVSLATQPMSYVVFVAHSDNRTLGLASPVRLFFNPSNWNTPQTITVTGVDDQDIDPSGDRVFNIIHCPVSSVDPVYNNQQPAAVPVTNHDVDTPMIVVTPTSGLTTTKAGGTATYSLSLNLQPTAPVTVHVHSSNTSAATVSPTDITFTLDDFDQPHVVTVTGVNDGTQNSIAYTIINDAAVSSDTRYNGLKPSDVSGTTISTNLPPIANDDKYTVHKNITLSMTDPTKGVLANDSDPQSLPLTAVEQTAPAHGTLTLNSNGTFSYKPDQGYTGSDSFTYVAQDQYSQSKLATVTFTIVNDPPVAVDDSYDASNAVEKDVSSSVGVLANDSDPNSDPLTAILVTNVSHGTLTLNPDGSFAYTPTPGYVGKDSFTYKASDGQLNSNIATVTFNDYTPAQVTQVAVNGDATQVQRSQVLSLKVTFNMIVTLPSQASNAFQVIGPDGQAVNLSAAVDNSSGVTVVNLTFLAGPDTYQLANGTYALKDGRYQLTVLKNQVNDSAGHTMDASVVSNFFRLFGDVRGTGLVDNKDLALFRLSLYSKVGDANYKYYFDFNMDGQIDHRTLVNGKWVIDDKTDSNAFLANYYKTV